MLSIKHARDPGSIPGGRDLSFAILVLRYLFLSSNLIELMLCLLLDGQDLFFLFIAHSALSCTTSLGQIWLRRLWNVLNAHLPTYLSIPSSGSRLAGLHVTKAGFCIPVAIPFIVISIHNCSCSQPSLCFPSGGVGGKGGCRYQCEMRKIEGRDIGGRCNVVLQASLIATGALVLVDL